MDSLPFNRTRGLKNPWNANRDVKIAKDGTELETNVGAFSSNQVTSILGFKGQHMCERFDTIIGIAAGSSSLVLPSSHLF